MNYKREIDRIYKKIDTLAQMGDDSIMEFRNYIDEISNSGNYYILIDVLETKYKIDTEKFRTVEDLKKESFKTIKFNTKSKTLINLSKLFQSKNVYNQGYHFYDQTTNRYLGDIYEIEAVGDPSNLSIFNKKLKEKISTTELYYIQVVIGDISSYKESIPPYDQSILGNITYTENTEIFYNNLFYRCVEEYDWSFGSPITPTYSQYWNLISIPTYSVSKISDGTKTLLEKYSLALDILKSQNLNNS
jgi:hypothetical protein